MTSVPKTTIHKNRDPLRLEQEIRHAEDFSIVKNPATNGSTNQSKSHDLFGGTVSGASNGAQSS
jgi:hypothetical protein